MNTETDKFYYRQLIYKNFLDIVESLNTTHLTKNMIKKHRKYINNFDLKGNAKYKTCDLLNSYYNTNFKDDALVGMYIFGSKKYLL